MTRRRIAMAVSIASALALVAAAPAGAATARVDVDTGQYGTTLVLIYQADPGEVNTVNVGIEPDGWYRIHDPGATIAVGTRCEAASGGDARCFANAVEVRTGDMNDTVGGDVGAAIERISGGPGDDTLDLPGRDPIAGATVMGGDGNDTLRDADTNSSLLQGGAGDDVLDGGTGANVLDGGPGSDRISGGEGVDTLANEARLDGVTVDLAQGYATAAGGERDELDGIENVRGGLGADVLSGDDGPNTIGGGAGDDTIHGAGANDVLMGDSGADAVSGDSGNDTLYAGSNYGGDQSPNSLSGGSGRDELVGGERKDLFDGGPGGDLMRGMGGRDVYMARDGEFDWIACGGRNRGQVLLDVHDFAHNCGRVERAGAARAIFVYAVMHLRKYDVGVACPSDMPRPCAGTYRLVFDGRRTRRGRWTLKPGESPESVYFETKLNTAEQKAVERAPAASVVLRLVTRDARGHGASSDAPFPGPPIASWPDYAFGTTCDGCAPDR